MKIGLMVLCLFAIGFCAGGDTINYSTAVRTLADGEPFWANQHWHSATDTIARVVNGRLGNVNISATANISPMKLDTTARAKFKSLTADTLKGDVTGNLTGTADSSKGAHHLSGGAVVATTVSSTRDSTGVMVVKDSIKSAIYYGGESGTFGCTLSDNGTNRVNATASYYKIGKSVTILYPDLYYSSMTGGVNVILKNAFGPFTRVAGINPIYLVSGTNGGVTGLVLLRSQDKSIVNSNYTYLDAGSSGLYSFCITILVSN